MAMMKIKCEFKQMVSILIISICIHQGMAAQIGRSQPTNAQNGNSHGVIVEDTVLSMRMNDSLSSKTSRVGDKFTATVTVPIYVDGKVAIPAGATVEGKVTQVTPARRMNKGGIIGVEFEEITLPNGLSTKIDGVLTSDDPEIQKRIDEENRMSGGKSKDTGIFIGQSGAIGAVLGGITGGGKGAMVGGAVGAGVGLASVLFSKGEEAGVPAGTTFGIRLKQALPIPDDMDLNTGAIQNPSQQDNTQNPIPNNTDPSSTESRPRLSQGDIPDKNGSTTSASKSSSSDTQEIPQPTGSNADENLPDTAQVNNDLPLSSPEMIRRAQQALRENGYYEGEINGEMTPRTQNALKAFQHENHLPETGLLDVETARGLKLIGTNARSKPAQSFPSQPDLGSSSRKPAPKPANDENANASLGTNREFIQSAANVRVLAANLLAEYQQMIGAKMTDNGVEFERDSKHTDGDIDLLFALDSFSNAANLFNRMVPSLRTTTATRNAVLSLAREARRTDKVFTTTSSRWTGDLSPKWDSIRQLILKMMYSYNINVSELDN